MTIPVYRQHLWMGFVQPQRCGGCGGGQVHGDAGSAEPVDHMVEPLERERALDRLDLVPAENCQRYDVHAGLTPTLLLFLRVGVCGGFTTFSTFSLESLVLLEDGRPVLFGGYVLLSVTLCLAGVWLGKHLIA